MNKSMIYFWQLLAACTFCFVFVACSKDNDEPGGKVTLLSATELVFTSNDAEGASINFSATGDWTATPSDGWLKLDKRQGMAGSSLTLRVTLVENDKFDQRKGKVVVKDNLTGNSFEVNVTQGARDAVLVFSTEKTTLLIDSNEKKIAGSVQVSSNYSWSVSIPAGITWLSYTISEKSGNNATVTFYADPAKLIDYTAVSAGVSFNYLSQTRTPAAKTYQVVFEGIQATSTFSRTSDTTKITNIQLEDIFREGEYKASAVVNSNIAWKLGALPEFADITINGENTSSRFFQSKNSLFITLKKGKLDTENLNGTLQLLDAVTNKPVAVLNIQLKGVGEKFIFVDVAQFPASQEKYCFMFDAYSEDGYSSLIKNFTVEASNPEETRFYLVKLNKPWENPVKEGVNQWGDAVSNQVTNRWGGVDVAAVTTRRPVQGAPYELWMKSRSDYGEWQSSATEDRYFALFAVSAQRAATYDDLFDSDGELKDEFANDFIPMGQLAKPVEFYFYSPNTAEGATIKMGAGESTYVIDYESDAEMISVYEDVVRFGEGPYDWNGGTFLSGNELTATFEQGKLILKLKANTTGALRTFSCAIANYIDGSKKEVDYLLFTFKLEQAAR